MSCASAEPNLASTLKFGGSRRRALHGRPAARAVVGQPETRAQVCASPLQRATAHSPLRATLDHWFEDIGVRPRIVGEFEDSALLAVFAARGLGVFPVSQLGAQDVGLVRGLRMLGDCPGISEEVHAIWSRRGQHHPLVRQMVDSARGA